MGWDFRYGSANALRGHKRSSHGARQGFGLCRIESFGVDFQISEVFVGDDNSVDHAGDLAQLVRQSFSVRGLIFRDRNQSSRHKARLRHASRHQERN